MELFLLIMCGEDVAHDARMMKKMLVDEEDV